MQIKRNFLIHIISAGTGFLKGNSQTFIPGLYDNWG